MGNIQFEEEANYTREIDEVGEVPPIVNWVIKMGLAKEEKQANYVLLTFSVIMIVASILVARMFLVTPTPTAPPETRYDNHQSF